MKGPKDLEDNGLDAGGRWWAWRRERGRVELAKASEQGKNARGFYWRLTAFSSEGTQSLPGCRCLDVHGEGPAVC